MNDLSAGSVDVLPHAWLRMNKVNGFEFGLKLGGQENGFQV